MSVRKRKEGALHGNVSSVNPEPWSGLISYNQLESWQHDNQYILNFYRKPTYNYMHSFHSVFRWHNESINIWTHLVPGLLNLPLAAYLFRLSVRRYPQASSADLIVFACFFMGAGSMFLLSATFHTLSNHSPGSAKLWNQLDYAGISLMIWGSFVPSVYYGFFCDRHLQILYWTLISVIGLGCITASLHPLFRTPAYRPLRASMFVGMGLCAVFPVLHGLARYGIQRLRLEIGLDWMLIQGLLYIFGATLYAVRWPEKWTPGKYDLMGASHQIFHVCVILAATSHLIGLLKALHHRHEILGLKCIDS